MSRTCAGLLAILVGLAIFLVSCYLLTILSTLVAGSLSQQAATQAFTMHTLIVLSAIGTLLLGLRVGRAVRNRLARQ